MKPLTAKQSILYPLKEQDDLMTIDKIRPILNSVRQRKINSYYQMFRQPQGSQELSDSRVFNPEIKLTDKMFLTFYSKNIKRRSVSPEQTIKSQKKKNSSQIPPIKLYKATSKIKKHLISEIDFQEIERNLYKKQQSFTRYKLFCQKIKEKGSSEDKKKIFSTTRKLIGIGSQNLQKMQILKKKSKKKFWIKSLGKKNKAGDQNISKIQGKSFKSMKS